MSNILNQKIVLTLNSVWQVLGITTPKQALTSMFSTIDGENMSAKALRVEYEEIEPGVYNFDKPILLEPLSWDQWSKLPIRPFDNIIHTSKYSYRIPTILIAHNFSKTIMRNIKPTKKAIFERDNYTCQYTGIKLNPSKLNIDHIRAVSKNGDNDWTNLVTCSKEINSKKGAKSIEEAGLKLIRKPKKPLPLPMSSIIKEVRNRDWKIFLDK
jgi:5-methylcytosine-specific restriction endonuclease McrA